MSSIPKSGDRIPPENEFESIINISDGELWETLKGAGFEQGDFLPLYTWNPNSLSSVSFTATTWTYDRDLMQLEIRWDKLFPAGANSYVFGQMTISPGTDESVSVRIQNRSDGETVGEVTGITSYGSVTIGPVAYTPTSTGSHIIISLEWMESPGVNSTNLILPIITLGVEV